MDKEIWVGLIGFASLVVNVVIGPWVLFKISEVKKEQKATKERHGTNAKAIEEIKKDVIDVKAEVVAVKTTAEIQEAK